MGDVVLAGRGWNFERLMRIARRPRMAVDVLTANGRASGTGQKKARSLVRTINVADHAWSMLRRADERARLARLSPRERRDLGEDRVREELNRWPWQG
jgi:hypothetical protein